MPGHVALIDKAGDQRRTCQRLPLHQQGTDQIQPAHDQIAIRTGAEQLPEVARQAPAITSAVLRHVIQRDGPVERVMDELPRRFCRAVIEAFLPGGDAGDGVQCLRQIKQRIVFFQGIERTLHALQQSAGAAASRGSNDMPLRMNGNGLPPRICWISAGST